MHKCLFMAEYMLWSIIVNEHILESNPIYDYLFTVEEVNRRTLAGMPFRDAYKRLGLKSMRADSVTKALPSPTPT